MIEGIGVDLVSSERIREIIKKGNNRVLDRIFSKGELNVAIKGVSGWGMARSAERLAGFFAAKEAFLKAVGGGIFSIPFKKIEVSNKISGEPFIKLTVELRRLILDKFEKSIEKARLSISHEKGIAVAFVVLEKR